MDDKKKVLEIITGSSHQKQSDISITMDNIDKSAKEKLLPRSHFKNALKSMTEEGCSLTLPQGIGQDQW